MTAAFPQTYKFTRIEWPLISDRLGTSCCIAECLEEHYPGEDIIQRCDDLLDYKPGSILLIKDELDYVILALVLYAAAARVEKKTGVYFPRD